MDEHLLQDLAARLADAPPGLMVGSRFEPRVPPWRHHDASQMPVRPAAVLILLYPHESEWWLPLTLRPAHLGAHAGQISLPGGAVEPGETTVEAAIREYHEELGDVCQPIDVLGSLTPVYVRSSNFLVVPWVAASSSRPRFTPHQDEVEELIETPLAVLLNPANVGTNKRHYEGASYDAPYFAIGGHQVWGVTCAILGEFVTLLEGLRIGGK